MPDPYKTARLPGFLEQCEALVKAKPPTAIGAVAVGPWTIAMLLRNPETMLLDTFEDPQFIHDLMRVTTDFCKLVGRRHRQDRDRPQLLRADGLDQPDLARQLPGVHRARTTRSWCEHFKAKKVGVTTHICGTTYPIYEDLIACGFTTISFDLDQQADPKLYVDQLARFMEVAKGRAVAIGNVDATKFEKATKEEMEAEVRRCIDTAARTRASSCRRPARSRRARARDRQVVHGRRARLRPLRPRLRAERLARPLSRRPRGADRPATAGVAARSVPAPDAFTGAMSRVTAPVEVRCRAVGSGRATT